MKIGMRVRILNTKLTEQYGVIERIDNTRDNTVYLVRRFELEGYQWYDPSEIEIADRRVERVERIVRGKVKTDRRFQCNNGNQFDSWQGERRKWNDRRGKKTLAQLRLFMQSFDLQSRPVLMSERAEAIFNFMNGI